MYIEKAVKNINKINYDNIGKNIDEAQGDFIYEFLRRMAQFVKNENVVIMPPLVINIADLLGYRQEIELSKYCNNINKKLLENPIKKHLLEFYIQISLLADENNAYSKYCDVYEPLIRILNTGGDFYFRDNGLYVEGIGFWSIRNWYTNFLDKTPKLID